MSLHGRLKTKDSLTPTHPHLYFFQPEMLLKHAAKWKTCYPVPDIFIIIIFAFVCLFVSFSFLFLHTSNRLVKFLTDDLFWFVSGDGTVFVSFPNNCAVPAMIRAYLNYNFRRTLFRLLVQFPCQECKTH